MVGRGALVLLSPQSARDSLLIVGGLLVVGALYFVALFIFNREVLETEPGDVSVFKH